MFWLGDIRATAKRATDKRAKPKGRNSKGRKSKGRNPKGRNPEGRRDKRANWLKGDGTKGRTDIRATGLKGEMTIGRLDIRGAGLKGACVDGETPNRQKTEGMRPNGCMHRWMWLKASKGWCSSITYSRLLADQRKFSLLKHAKSCLEGLKTA